METKQQTRLFLKDSFYIGNLKDMQHTHYMAKRMGNACSVAVKQVKDKQNIAYVKVGVMFCEKQHSLENIAHSVLEGVKMCGAQGYNFKDGFMELCAYCCFYTLCDICMYVYADSEGEVCAQILGPSALSVSNSFERAYKQAMQQPLQEAQSFVDEPNKAPFCHIVSMEGTQNFYEAALVRACEKIAGKEALCGVDLVIDAQNLTDIPGAKAFLQGLFCTGANISSVETQEANKDIQNAIKIYLSNDEPGIMLSQNGHSIDFVHMNAVILSYFSQNRKNFVLPFLGPEIYRKILSLNLSKAGDYGDYPEKAVYFSHTDAVEDMYLKDRFLCATIFLSIMKSSGLSIFQLLRTIPEFFIYSTGMEDNHSSKRQRVMAGFAAQSQNHDEQQKDGIRLAFSKGRVTVLPHRAGGYSLIAEAYSAEAAKEICQKAQDMLNGKA